jgi:hypothetical protein
LPILAQKLSRLGDWGGSNLDANSLQSGSVLDAIQQSMALALINSVTTKKELSRCWKKFEFFHPCQRSSF